LFIVLLFRTDEDALAHLRRRLQHAIDERSRLEGLLEELVEYGCEAKYKNLADHFFVFRYDRESAVRASELTELKTKCSELQAQVLSLERQLLAAQTELRAMNESLATAMTTAMRLQKDAPQGYSGDKGGDSDVDDANLRSLTGLGIESLMAQLEQAYARLKKVHLEFE
jgi:hypothetical protein